MYQTLCFIDFFVQTDEIEINKVQEPPVVDTKPKIDDSEEEVIVTKRKDSYKNRFVEVSINSEILSIKNDQILERKLSNSTNPHLVKSNSTPSNNRGLLRNEDRNHGIVRILIF